LVHNLKLSVGQKLADRISRFNSNVKIIHNFSIIHLNQSILKKSVHVRFIVTSLPERGSGLKVLDEFNRPQRFKATAALLF
jgi:hypothetical protein